MSPFEVGLISVVAMVALIYMGMYIPIALGVVSFLTIWIIRDNFNLSMALLKVAGTGAARMEALQLAEIFRANVVDKIGRAHV